MVALWRAHSRLSPLKWEQKMDIKIDKEFVQEVCMYRVPGNEVRVTLERHFSLKPQNKPFPPISRLKEHVQTLSF
jgi:hypothetical protein